MKDLTKRAGIKWVKITHRGFNSYAVAFGFKGDIKATRVETGTKNWAYIAANNWLEDQ